MSSFVQIDPMPHASWVTRVVRLDGDFTLSVAVDKGGTVSYNYYNVQGIPDDYTYKPDPVDENLEEAVISKEGTNESVVFRVKVYYNASDETLEDHQIPRAWTYGATIDKDNYLPGSLPDSISQTFPVTIWNTLKPGQNPPSTNTASAISFDTLYDRLGSAAARKRDLANKVIGIINNPDLEWLLDGGMMPAISGQRTSTQEVITITFDRSQRVQGFWFWLETIARAISLDSNLEGTNGERNFNLLDGELSLDLLQLIGKIPTSLPGDIANVMPRTGWHFRKFGDVASSSPYAYTVPSYNVSIMPTTQDATIDIGSSVPSEVTTNWRAWLRSLV